jgi:hypothetical protein
MNFELKIFEKTKVFYVDGHNKKIKHFLIADNFPDIWRRKSENGSMNSL